ncbi:HAD family hydrolase [Natribaculum luteum]|uniref:HAD family hydrolase n=1 Tax=Natribaculum luteum TaxID=1586232 RepID=A0ABD5NXW7_9EURY|nr:HAD family hydrolase [Natribaculum luteum]
MAAYDAIYFDLDSTLCEPIQGRSQLLETAFERAGVDQFCTVAGLRAASNEVTDAETDQEFFERTFEEAADRAGADPAVSPDLASAYLETIDPAAVRFRSGAEAALDLADERGPVGLITNGTEEMQSQKLEALGISDFFDVTVFVDPRDGVPPKPHSKPFEMALSGIDVEPSGTIYVGDNVYTDVAGANAMGMDSAWINLGHETAPEHEPTYELASLEEFETIV